MVKITATYTGEKHCELTHESSGSHIETDAPRDNAGRGERFSPTDLVGAALLSCILTTMAIVAERDGVDMKSATGEVTKEMKNDPRAIATLAVKVTLPAEWDEVYRKKMERVAHTCPVHRSLHPDMNIPIQFMYV